MKKRDRVYRSREPGQGHRTLRDLRKNKVPGEEAPYPPILGEHEFLKPPELGVGGFL